jgi:hypothetical protein
MFNLFMNPFELKLSKSVNLCASKGQHERLLGVN